MLSKAVQQALLWAVALLEDLSSDPHAARVCGRVKHWLREKIDLRTQFSGMDCFRMAADRWPRRLGGQVLGTEAGDLDKTCQRILKAWAKVDAGESGVQLTGDILDDLTPQAKFDLQAISTVADHRFREGLQNGGYIKVLRRQIGD